MKNRNWKDGAKIYSIFYKVYVNEEILYKAVNKYWSWFGYP